MTPFSATAQCTGSSQVPSSPIVASAYNDTVLVTEKQKTGNYYVVTNLALNQSYVFLSSNAGDYITIRNVYTKAVLAHGPVPFTYAVGAGPDVVTVHITLASPACGNDLNFRITRLACTTCPAMGPKVGVNKASPQATLDLGGELKLGNNQRPPEAGMIRWNPQTKDFEGYNGNQWLSLTGYNAPAGNWGQASVSTMNENARIIASDGRPDDRFGWSVSISGDYALVGARLSDPAGQSNQGAAYLYNRGIAQWPQFSKWIASDGIVSDGFGISVCIGSDHAIIGASSKDIADFSNQGAAYIFRKN